MTSIGSWPPTALKTSMLQSQSDSLSLLISQLSRGSQPDAATPAGALNYQCSTLDQDAYSGVCTSLKINHAFPAYTGHTHMSGITIRLASTTLGRLPLLDNSTTPRPGGRPTRARGCFRLGSPHHLRGEGANADVDVIVYVYDYVYEPQSAYAETRSSRRTWPGFPRWHDSPGRESWSD